MRPSVSDMLMEIFENNKYIYNYVDHLGNVRISYKSNGSGAEVLEENNYYPFGLKHDGYNILGGNPSYNYKYNGKELQVDSGMYDYGARFYMSDIGRWGVVDPRSEYTHEAYSYVWNNPISFNDPTGMTGEDWAFPIRDGLKDGEVWHDSDGLFTWNAKKGLWIDASNKSSVITQVSMLKESDKSSGGYNMASAAALGTANIENPVGWGILAGLLGLAIYQEATRPHYEWYTPTTTLADPGAGYRSMNTEDNAESGTATESETDSTDVNGVNVPDARKGGGKNGQHANLKAKQSAGEKYEEAKSKLDSISRKPNKTKEDNKLKTQLEKQVKHWKAKAQETGENHSRNAKGNR